MKVQNYEIIERHANLCRLMGHAGRLMIMKFICDEEKSVGEIAQAIGASVSTTSQHLRLLRDSNVVHGRREGRTIYYNLKYPKLLEACQLIREVILEDMLKGGKAVENMDFNSQVKE
ncbi:MAG: metalloregulator ArsR/SmtB family transcription factor [Chloroflexota bacterium]|nr:metalloregulator ArsR/SmtB family transcription factor [Chloroflexota bacterium]